MKPGEQYFEIRTGQIWHIYDDSETSPYVILEDEDSQSLYFCSPDEFNDRFTSADPRNIVKKRLASL